MSVRRARNDRERLTVGHNRVVVDRRLVRYNYYVGRTRRASISVCIHTFFTRSSSSDGLRASRKHDEIPNGVSGVRLFPLRGQKRIPGGRISESYNHNNNYNNSNGDNNANGRAMGTRAAVRMMSVVIRITRSINPFAFL